MQISAVAIATPPPEPKSTLSSPLTRGWDLITHNIPQAHRRKDADGPNDPIVRFLGLARVALFDQCGIQAEDYQFLDRIRFLSEGRFKIDLADYDSSTLTIYAFIGGERAVWVALDKDVWHKAVVSPDGSRQSVSGRLPVVVGEESATELIVVQVCRDCLGGDSRWRKGEKAGARPSPGT